MGQSGGAGMCGVGSVDGVAHRIDRRLAPATLHGCCRPVDRLVLAYKSLKMPSPVVSRGRSALHTHY